MQSSWAPSLRDSRSSWNEKMTHALSAKKSRQQVVDLNLMLHTTPESVGVIREIPNLSDKMIKTIPERVGRNT